MLLNDKPKEVPGFLTQTTQDTAWAKCRRFRREKFSGISQINTQTCKEGLLIQFGTLLNASAVSFKVS